MASRCLRLHAAQPSAAPGTDCRAATLCAGWHLAALAVAVRRAALYAESAGPHWLLGPLVCGLRVLSAGARPWLLRPRFSSRSYGSRRAALDRRVGLVVRFRSRCRPPVRRLASCPCARRPPPGPFRGPGPYLVLRALVGALRAPGARRAGPARSARAGLAVAVGGLLPRLAGVGLWASPLAGSLRGLPLPPSRLLGSGRPLRPLLASRAPPLRRSPGPVGGGAARLVLWPLRGWAVIGASSQTTPQTLAGQTPRRPRQQGYGR